MQQRSHIGNDGWGTVGEYLDEIGAGSVLLVTGRTMFANSGAEEALRPILEGRRVRRVFEFEVNPKAGDVDRILGELKSEEAYEAILAVGGGSVMDVGKLVKAFWNADKPVASYLSGGESLPPSDIPLVAVPSTAGSGSEATHFAVVYDGKTKYSVADEKLLPDLAVVIPKLLESVPSHVGAASGMDALCQGIESYWSIYSTEESRAFASEAIRLAWAALDGAINRREPKAFEEMAKASHLAGRAINLTKTTAPHAVSYAFSAFYGLQHGHAVGLLVPGFLRYNAGVSDADTLDERGADWVRRRLAEIADILGCSDASEAADAIFSRTQALELETDFGRLGIHGDEGLAVIVANGFNPQRVNNNPRHVTEPELWGILRNLAGSQ